MAQVPDPSSSDFGGAGLLQTRTARFMADGTLNVGYLKYRPYERYLITLTPLPRVEATFRYTKVNNRDFAGNVAGRGSTFTDRGADVKLLVARERRFLPQIAIGIQDGLGTGLFSGEYFAMSKRFYDFDFSAGLGWGYNAGAGEIRNPLINISKSFRSRTGQSSQGGTLIPTSWFSGERVGAFFGAEYHTPIKGLSVKLEYEPNDYQNEPLSNELAATSRFNYGINYRPFPWIDLTFARERGERFMFRANLRANLHEQGIPKLDPPPVELRVRPPAETSVTQPIPALRPVVARFLDALEVRRVRGDTGNDRFGELFEYLENWGVSISEIAIEGDAAYFHTSNQLPPVDRVALSEALSKAFSGSADWVVFVPGGETYQIKARQDIQAAVRVSGGQFSLPAVRQMVPLFETFDQSLAVDGIKADAREQRLQIDAVNFGGRRVTVVLSSGPYRQVARNIGRAARIAANHSPDWIEELEIILSGPAGETASIVVLRSDLEAAVTASGSPEEIAANAVIGAPKHNLPATAIKTENYPNIRYSVSPALRQHIGSGDRFYLYQLFLRASSRVQVTPRLSVVGSVGADLYNNFDRLTVESDSRLPRVRSEIRQYLQQGENNLIQLQANYMWSPWPDIFARLSAGYFETMFGGYGGEILYRPFGSRLAAGIELGYVRQRTFEQRFDFRDYTVVTGHLNLTYAVPFYELLAQLSIGQYLAGDRGATFQVSRRFDSGVRIGGFVTLTDVPFNVFGEGSFDKGFFISIPFDLFSTRSSTSGGTFGFRPLTKDGGQKLATGPALYDVTASGNIDEIGRDWREFLN